MAYLQVLTGVLKDRIFDFDRDELTIGRSADNTISLDNPAVSGRHCSVVRSGKQYSLKDPGSTNGTQLNGRLCRDSRLKPKDVITVGPVEILFDGDDVEVEPEPKPSELGRTGETIRLPGGAGASSAFEQRKDYKWMRWAVAGVFLLVAVIAGVFFVIKVVGLK